MKDIISFLEDKVIVIKKQLLDLALKESIHIGGDMSSVDIMTALWQYKMKYNPLDPKDESRDRFILSKGHASALLNFEQAMLGCYSENKIFDEYAQDGKGFAMHACNMTNPFVEASTGSLGHGLSIASGIAQGLKLKGNKNSRVYVLMGDGEQSEGSVWESVMNASQYKLGNLIAIIDNNNLESDGYVNELTALGNIADKYKTFGWNAIEINGHDMEEIVSTLDNLPEASSDRPTVIVAHTVKGNGISFMKDNVRWHAGKLNAEQYATAISEIEVKKCRS